MKTNKKSAVAATWLTLAVGLCHAEQADKHPHWGYDAKEGPRVWAILDSDWKECAAGQHQSPIDLPAAIGMDSEIVESAHIALSRDEHELDVVNNGHTVQVNYDGGEELELHGKQYRLVQFHFHEPSEHTIAGVHFPMEMHLVHQAEDGELAVIGIFLERGHHNDQFDPVWTHMPRAVGLAEHLEHVKVDIDDLLPASRSAFTYEGSLTTPPCTEGVQWLVLRTPVAIGADQIHDFAVMVHGNSRPTQPLGDRSVAGTEVMPAE